MKIRFLFLLSIAFVTSACSGGGGGATDKASLGKSAIVGFTDWESNMLTFGESLCQQLKNETVPFDTRLLDTYYDAEWIFYQIADYSGDSRWNDCAQAAEKIYRDGYVLPNNGQVPGYWNFSHGLTQDFLRTGDLLSKQAALLLTQNAAFAADTVPLSATVSTEQSREVAYIIHALLNAEDMNEPHRPKLDLFVDQALGHFDQWFVSKTSLYVRPFMVALSAHALINYYEHTGDPRIIPALITGLDWLWDHTWDGHAAAFRYTDRVVPSGGTDPAPDLNLLIAPAYAWVYRQTKEQRFADRADQIFFGGSQLAFLNNGKQFNQNYRWSFDFIKWR